MVKLEKKFKEGFKKLNWIESDINDLWKLVLKQSEYSFNLGHSQAYGLLSYLTAYLKFYYPAQYMKALLNSVKDNPQQMAKYMAECESMSIKVLPPNINKSNIDFRTDDNKILFGISAIKGIGEGFAEKVIENREYVSVRDFIEKNKPNSSQIVKLIKSGAFGRNKKVLLDNMLKMLI
jgi:DNA polymerase-3 subunit alpha